MAHANSDGVKIYYEVEGQGLPLVLGHGLTGDTTFWRGYGYVDRLKDEYTVILFDARGHGRSDKPHEPHAYDYQLMVRDVIAVLDSLRINRAHYWGYSMGGYTGLGLAMKYPKRLLSLIVGGIDPFRQPEKEDEPNELRTIFQRGVIGGVEEVVEGMRALFGSITPQYEQRLRQLDLKAMVAYVENARSRPGFAVALPQMTVPCLLYAGDEDEGAFKSGPRSAQMMPNARFFSLPGLNHAGAGAAVEPILHEIRSFLA